MATTGSMYTPTTARTCCLYKNGNTNFPGKRLVVNPKKIPNFECFMAEAQKYTEPTRHIRDIRTPNGTRITTLAEIINGTGNYVMCCGGKFQKFDYPDIPNTQPTHKKPDYLNIPPHHSKIKAAGRATRTETHSKTIKVYANGVTYPCTKLLLPWTTMTSLKDGDVDKILDLITEKVRMTNGSCVRRLYKQNGDIVKGVGDLTGSEYYVAAGGNNRQMKFIDVEYSVTKPLLNTSPRGHKDSFLPALVDTPRKIPPKKHGQSNSQQKSTGDSDKATTKPNKNSKTDNKRTITKNEKEKKEDNGVFHAKPVKHKRSSEKDKRTDHVDYDRDEGGVFKAKIDNKATKDAEEVEDSNETAVDLPIDQVEAEEVKDEEIETENNVSKTTSDETVVKKTDDENKETTKETEDKGESQAEAEAADEAEADEAAEKEKAAVTLQANYRGYAVRKQLKEQQGNSNDQDEKVNDDPAKEMTNENEEEQKKTE